MKNPPCRDTEQQIEGEKQAVDIPNNNDEHRRQHALAIVALPHHRDAIEEEARNSLCNANLLKPTDDFLGWISVKKGFYSVHYSKVKLKLLIKTTAI